jgi:hypothetical protein
MLINIMQLVPFVQGIDRQRPQTLRARRAQHRHCDGFEWGRAAEAPFHVLFQCAKLYPSKLPHRWHAECPSFQAPSPHAERVVAMHDPDIRTRVRIHFVSTTLHLKPCTQTQHNASVEARETQ